MIPLERNLYGHPLAGLPWERQFEEALLELGREKIPNWECMFVHWEQGLFLSVYVDDIKMAGKKQSMALMEAIDEKMWTLTNPHHVLTMCPWDALSGNAGRMQQSLTSVQRTCLNHFLLLEQQKFTGRNLAHKQ